MIVSFATAMRSKDLAKIIDSCLNVIKCAKFQSHSESFLTALYKLQYPCSNNPMPLAL